MMDAQSSWQFLEQFLAGELTIIDFERWFKSSPNLEEALGSRAYGELHAFDFRQRTPQDLASLVQSIYGWARPGRLARDRGFRIARGLISGQVPVQEGVRTLAALCLDGHDWVPALFVSVQSDFDKIPRPEQYEQWEPDALSARLEEGRQMTRLHRPAILDGARAIIADYQRDFG